MANEFKIKTGLILGAAPTQPVTSITDSSSFSADASSQLSTVKATYGFVQKQIVPINASINRIDASMNNTINAYSIFCTSTYVDGSLSQYATNASIGLAGFLKSTDLNPYATNASIGLAGFATNSSVNNALGSYATNSSIGNAGFAKNASLGLYATNASVGLALGPYATNSSVGLAIAPFATNASVGTALGKYIPSASTGTGLYWNPATHLLDVSVAAAGGSSTLAGLLDVSIADLSTNQFLRYDYATSKWKNVSPVEASLYFWPLSTALLRESSIGTGFNWNAGMLDVSGGGDVTKAYVDGSLANFIRSSSTGFGLYWNSGLLDVSVSGGGAGLSIKETSSNYTTLSNYIILANSSWNTVDITLPSTPANGDIVQVIDINKSASTNNINILRNTHKIDMSTNNFTLDVNGGSIELIYHALNDNFAILNLEILEEFTGSTAIGDVTKLYVDGSLAARDASINALFTIVLDTSVLEIGTPTADGSWRLIIDTSGNLSVQKRITGSWVEKGNFS